MNTWDVFEAKRIRQTKNRIRVRLAFNKRAIWIPKDKCRHDKGILEVDPKFAEEHQMHNPDVK